MDLNAVVLLTKIIEQKSFSKAAKVTGVPTSTISRKISDLEAHLSIQLLERTTRKLRLTEAGRVFYEQVQPAVYALISAQQHLTDKKAKISGTLRLSIPPGLEQSIIIPLLVSYKKLYPQVCIKVIASASKLRFVEDGIDVALRLGTLQDSNNIAHKLLEYNHILVASPKYLAKNIAIHHPNDLLTHHLICASNWLNDKHWDFIKKDKKISLNINESLSINHYASMQSATEKGMGICELPAINVIQAIKNNLLLEVLPDWKLDVYGSRTMSLSIVYTSNRYNSLTIKNFKKFCIDYFKKMSA